jgi:hypothetical protein
MQIHPVAVGMVIRRNEMDILVPRQKIDHAREFSWKIKIVVLREINNTAIFLPEENLNLLCEGRFISHPRKINKDQILGVKISSEHVYVFIWASIEQNPKLHVEAAERLLEGTHTDFSQSKLMVAEGKAEGRYSNLGTNSVCNSQVVLRAIFLKMHFELLAQAILKGYLTASTYWPSEALSGLSISRAFGRDWPNVCRQTVENSYFRSKYSWVAQSNANLCFQF